MQRCRRHSNNKKQTLFLTHNKVATCPLCTMGLLQRTQPGNVLSYTYSLKQCERQHATLFYETKCPMGKPLFTYQHVWFVTTDHESLLPKKEYSLPPHVSDTTIMDKWNTYGKLWVEHLFTSQKQECDFVVLIVLVPKIAKVVNISLQSDIILTSHEYSERKQPHSVNLFVFHSSTIAHTPCPLRLDVQLNQSDE